MQSLQDSYRKGSIALWYLDLIGICLPPKWADACKFPIDIECVFVDKPIDYRYEFVDRV